MIEILLSAVATVGAVGLLLASWMFARSLLPGATPLVSRFALAEDPITAGQPFAGRYLRILTLLWAMTLLVCAAFVAWRVAGALTISPLIGMFAPVALAALLFFGERFVRRRVFGLDAVGPVGQQWRIATGIMRGELSRQWPSGFSRPSAVFCLPDKHRKVIVWRTGDCSVEALQAAAHELSTTLPPGRRVLVACDDRAVFMWAVLAAWAARRTVVMPPADLKLARGMPHHAEIDCVVTDRCELAGMADLPTLRIGDTALRNALDAQPARTPEIRLPAEHVAAVFFTSGSTGRPTAQPKTWRQLVEAADAMADLLSMRQSGALLGSTVVHSHMFGFEMLVMQVLRGSCAVYAPRIVYPSDLVAFAEVKEGLPRWLATTPYHLGLFADVDPLPRGLQRVVSATMPLDPALAAKVEAATGAQVHEIYGSTEAGCIATRRPVASHVWRLATDLQLRARDDGTTVLQGGRVGGALPMRDRLALVDGGFELRGRDTDLVKVAGKRASLQALTAMLREIPGVEDGVFIDGAALDQRRLAALVVAPKLSGEVVRAALAARIDAAFLPRPLVLVASLPRDANGKLVLEALVKSAAGAHCRSASARTEELPSDVG